LNIYIYIYIYTYIYIILHPHLNLGIPHKRTPNMGSTAASAPIRLAILEADTPVPNANAKYHGYRGVFTDLFRRALAPEPLEAHLDITGYDVVNEPDTYPDLDSIDAVLITGSKHSAYLDDEWIVKLVAFTRKALATNGRVKVVGICFGHQIVGRALGVKVDRNDKGWEVSVTEIKLSEAGRALFGSDTMVRRASHNSRATLLDVVLSSSTNAVSQRIHQMHRDIVFSNPEGAQNLGENDVCATQGFLLPGRAITVQGHPEFTGEITTEILELRHDTNVLTDEVYSSGVDRANNDHDGVKIAQAFLRFMQGQETFKA
jgi:GMP synthase-like glutamine amidotransferase